MEELNQIIEDEKLNKEETYTFVNNAFRDGYVQTTGTGLAKILPPVPRFTPTGERTQKRETVIEKKSFSIDSGIFRQVNDWKGDVIPIVVPSNLLRKRKIL